MARKINIAIDGWSSCGKSTLAKQLAQALQYTYVDSGAMYRAITYYFLQHSVDLTNKTDITEALKNIQITYKNNADTGLPQLFLNGKNVEQEIRSMQVANKVSEISAIGEVRTFAVALQQQMAAQKGIVMDGRDIGTTVIPDAELKLFLTAQQEVRTQRRYEELLPNNPNLTIDEVSINLEMRDFTDANRAISPLRKAADAITIDNTNLTKEEQFTQAYQLATKAIADL